jgi:hypothetical protein
LGNIKLNFIFHHLREEIHFYMFVLTIILNVFIIFFECKLNLGTFLEMFATAILYFLYNSFAN